MADAISEYQDERLEGANNNGRPHFQLAKEPSTEFDFEHFTSSSPDILGLH